MRHLGILFAVSIATSVAYAGEVTTTLDRCVVLNDESDATVESRIAMHFTMPNEVAAREVVYAELHIPLSIENQDNSPLFEIRLFPALSNWSEGGIDFETAGQIADTLSLGSFTVKLAESNDFYIDITSFVNDISSEERSNYGFIGVGDLLGESNLQLPDSLSQTIKNSARVRFKYK